MEIGSSHGRCVDYDVDGGRIFVVVETDRTEIHVRPQVHRLVRHMVERNAASGGSPVLCSHDELMHAVWGDEPMHTRTELAKLVWELRRQLEPHAAAEALVNEPRRGYRLVTCARAHETSTAAVAGSPREDRGGHRRAWILVVLTTVLVLAAGAALVLTRGSGGGSTGEAQTEAAAAAFVARIENVLEQSAGGRREIRAALNAGLRCAISPEEAARRISSVADNRQSILQQLGTLQAPTRATDRAVTLLQRALQQSIEADRHYRDGFLELQAGARCPLPSNPSFRLAATSDRLATAAKRRFVAAFDPLARAAGRRTWSAAGF